LLFTFIPVTGSSLYLARPSFDVVPWRVTRFYQTDQSFGSFDQILLLVAQQRVKGPTVLFRIFMFIGVRNVLIPFMNVLRYFLEMVVS
jgi:hypothetical protein